jgi:uncharacterized protein (DUF2126 family)
MTYRATVRGSSTRDSHFGIDTMEVESPASVREVDGVLIITTLPWKPRPSEAATRRPRKATRGSVVCYPRGGWDKVTVTDFIDEEASDGTD